MIEPVKKAKRPQGMATFQGFPLGEKTSVPSFALDPREMSECIDFKMNPGGQLETRAPLIKYTTTEIGSIVDIEAATVDGSDKVFCSDDDNKIYWINTTTTTAGTTVTPTQISTSGVENTPYLIGYNDELTIQDGSYLKYCDSLTAIKMAYDAGDDGNQYDNYSGSDDTTLSAARVAAKFTSEAWTAGYTIPVTKITAKVQESGGTASITAKLRLVSDDSILASKLYAGTVPSAAAGYIDIEFESTDITTEMSPGVPYYASLEGTNFNVQCTTVASGGVGYTYAPSTWTAVATKNPIMKVHPGSPPKAEFMRIVGNKPWVKDPDDPGLAKFGNYTIKDWSTTNGGGSVGSVDENKNSFEIGAFEEFYGDLYVYGTQTQPYLCKLTGSTPTDYALPRLFQRAWSTPRTLINTNSDLFAGSKDGVYALGTIQEFGDVRDFSASDPIKNRLSNWDSATAIAGYNPKDGQYWLYMPSYGDYVSVCHTRQGIIGPDGKIRYPWTRYKLPITPTCFKQIGDMFLVGATDGYIYKLDDSEYKDLTTTQILPSFKTAYMPLPFKTSDLTKCQLLGSSTNGTNLDIDFYVNGNFLTSLVTYNLALPMSDSVTIDDLGSVTIGELSGVAIAPDGSPLYFNTNINCYSFQIGVSNISLVGSPMFINGIIIQYEGLE